MACLFPNISPLWGGVIRIFKSSFGRGLLNKIYRRARTDEARKVCSRKVASKQSAAGVPGENVLRALSKVSLPFWQCTPRRVRSSEWRLSAAKSCCAVWTLALDANWAIAAAEAPRGIAFCPQHQQNARGRRGKIITPWGAREKGSSSCADWRMFSVFAACWFNKTLLRL